MITMDRRTTTLDTALTHLWVDDQHTECGLEAQQNEHSTQLMCVPCLDRYGADVVAAHPYLQWLGLPGAPTVHAFEPAHLDKDRAWPVCHMYSIRVWRLKPRSHRMRCPNCVRSLSRPR